MKTSTKLITATLSLLYGSAMVGTYVWVPLYSAIHEHSPEARETLYKVVQLHKDTLVSAGPSLDHTGLLRTALNYRHYQETYNHLAQTPLNFQF